MLEECCKHLVKNITGLVKYWDIYIYIWNEMKWNEMKFYGLKLQGKVSFKKQLRWKTRMHKKFLELKYNENVVNINYAGHIYK